MNHEYFFGDAKWMTVGSCGVFNVRREFELPTNVKCANITLCGLGMYELRINGEKVNDDLYGTLYTDFKKSENEECFNKFGEEVGHRIYVSKFDITDKVTNKNCIGVTLAPGWYRADNITHLSTNYGFPVLCFKIECELDDGRKVEVLSDENLRFKGSNIVSHHFFSGEEHDYTFDLSGWDKCGYDDSEWSELSVAQIPETEFYAPSNCPPDRVIRVITPKLIGEVEDGYIYDAYENITGTPVLKQTSGGFGEKLTFKVSERLENGDIEDYTNHRQHSSFITDGNFEREYRLRFMWNGFRYIKVSKNAKVTEVEVIHSDVAVNSAFESSNDVLNFIYSTFIRTQLDNMHCGIPSDCPHLEKRGYTGDGELIAECGMLMLDSKEFYKKWMGDISDCQDRISGHVQYTAPYTHSGGGPGGWGCAIAEVPYIYWKRFGDKEIIKGFLPQIRKYFEYLEAHSENELVVSDQKGEWCLGDWCTAEEIAIPAPFVNTYFYVKTLSRIIEMSQAVGETEYLDEYKAVMAKKKAALNDNYFDESTGDYCKNVQGANAFALDIGLGDERTLKNLVKKYNESDYGFDTGIFGTDILICVLFEKGYADTAYKLLSSKGKYSFGNWMNDGCTTFPEYWTYKRSQNHPMFGAVTKYLFSEILGIKQVGEGYEKVTIDPKLIKGLDFAKGYIEVANGRVCVKVENHDSRQSVEIEIPEGVDAWFGKDKLPVGISIFER